MQTLRTICVRIRSLWQRGEVKREIDEELRFHLEQRTAENIAAGMTPEDAAREARKRFGNLQSVREECRDTRGVSLGENLWRDICFGIRMLRKSPGFTSLAVLTLGLGLGATATLFGVFNSLILNPFPYPHPDRIVFLKSSNYQPLSSPDYEDIRHQNKSFACLGGLSRCRYNLGLDSPASVYAARCTAGVLPSFGVAPALGRLFEEADEQPGAPMVAVLSDAVWQRLFSGDPTVLGRPIRLDAVEYTVVGIMPPDFEFQTPWCDGHDIELWTAFSPILEDHSRGSHWFFGIGRLKEGVTVEAADAEVKTIGARLSKEYPDTNQRKPFLVLSLRDMIGSNTRSGTMLLFGAAMMLLLVACANVASLLLARGTQRQGEFGVRLALGGGRRAILRLLLCESLMLALLGSGAGILLAQWGLVLMQHVIPATMIIGARREALHLDWAVLAFSVAAAAVTAVLFGLLPALTAARTPVMETLNGEGRSQTGTGLRHRFLWHLVAGQIAFALVLGNVAVLLFYSFLSVIRDNHQLVTDHVITAEISLKGDKYREEAARRSFWEAMFECIRALPGVEAVATTTKMPLEGGNNSNVLVDDQVYDPAIIRPLAEHSFVSPDYFAAMGIPVLRGRAPGPEDGQWDALCVAVNRTLAEKCWPGQDPIGKRIRSNDSNPWFQATVVGVVGDVRQWGAELSTLREIYFPADLGSEANLVVRATGDAHLLVTLLRNTLTGMDPDLPLANVRTMSEVVNKATASRRFLTQMVSLFMGMTLLLAMVGVYGTLSYIVSQRQREIGIRMALGAMRRDIVKFVMRLGAFWVLTGLAAGVLLTLGVSSFVRSFVYGVNALDPWVLFSGVFVVGVAAALACLLPARRAAKVEPMQALRCE